jgi:hypothetical protein
MTCPHEVFGNQKPDTVFADALSQGTNPGR